jgi:ribosome biogenesis GTPase / thiamine phosphate phosphatase
MATSSQPGSSLRDLGWSPEHAAAFRPHALAGLVPGRVISSGGSTMAMTAVGPSEVVVQRRWQRQTASAQELPTVGDWLALEPLPSAPGSSALRAVLPRRGMFVRFRPFDGQAQVLAANIDLAFLVSGLDHDLNVRRLERYLMLAIDGGVTPIVLLNKVDIALDVDGAVTEVHSVAPGTRVIVCSAITGAGLDEVRALVTPGSTACLLGSSGVGKSTITNALLGEQRQAVKTTREDDGKGRHTTSHRELFVLAGGGLLIDTPGLRTVGVLGERDSLAASFSDVASLARACRFSDCAHTHEPGCAVRAAVDAGDLPADRLASHHKLEAELRSVALRADEQARRAQERRQGRLYRRWGKLVSQRKRGEA